MRLIDADNLMTVTDIREDGTEITYVPYSEIEDAPTAYDPDKVVELLEEAKDIAHDDSVAEMVSTRIWNKAMQTAIGIVKAGGVNGN